MGLIIEIVLIISDNITNISNLRQNCLTSSRTWLIQPVNKYGMIHLIATAFFAILASSIKVIFFFPPILLVLAGCASAIPDNRGVLKLCLLRLDERAKRYFCTKLRGFFIALIALLRIFSSVFIVLPVRWHHRVSLPLVKTETVVDHQLNN